MATSFIPVPFDEFPLKNPIDNYSSFGTKNPVPKHPEVFPFVVPQHSRELDIPWDPIVPDTLP